MQILLGIEILGWNDITETRAWLTETADGKQPDTFGVSLDAMREFATGQHYLQFDKFFTWREAMLRRARAIGEEEAIAVLGMPAAGVRRLPHSDPTTIRIDGVSRAKEADRPLPPVDELVRYQDRAQWLYFAWNRILHWPRMLTTRPAERRELTAVLVADIVSDWMPLAGRNACYCWALEARYRSMRIAAHTFDDYISDERIDDSRASSNLPDVFASGDPGRLWPRDEQLREVKQVGPLGITRRYLNAVSTYASSTYRHAVECAP
ncbi:hypothetical protein QOZ88_07030 [Blastococcus sp. BMG 814]|uniref:Uncharacterized protein n=1 Tax=Blastococcus carthaginiensis TaxID=3050034 RepID=A0ABT9I9Y8_9ACTN|nr:hypothetical protein [Blastococcus carthaginiensis]MDP5182387.1 hypothetical protein [Blastococcus carthaginiensis]